MQGKYAAFFLSRKGDVFSYGLNIKAGTYMYPNTSLRQRKFFDIMMHDQAAVHIILSTVTSL